MKKVIVTAFCALFSVGVFAQANTNKLPATAQDFINKHFSSISIEAVEENSNWKIWEDEKYEVRLANGIEVDFDESGHVIEIDSNNSEAIPMAALPSKIASYLQSNHPNSVVISWDVNDKEQEVELSDGTEVEFDADGNFRRLD